MPINALLGRQVWLAGWPTAMAGSPATKRYNAAGNTDASRRTVKLVDWSKALTPPGPARRTASGEIRTGSSAAMTAGGPGYSSDLPAMFMYSLTFSRGQMGMGSASAILMLGAILAIIVPYLYSELRTKRND